MKRYILVLFPWFIGCCFNSGKNVVETRPAENFRGNFILYVSNQSSHDNPIDIEISIDGVSTIKGSFDYGKRETLAHNWEKFQFEIPKGEHVLRIVSKEGRAEMEKRIVITGKHWVVIDYWFSVGGVYGMKIDREFTFAIDEKPIYFR